MNREQVVASTLFDSAYYCARYHDVVQAKVDPYEHYLEFGWRELRDPNPYFNTSAYLTLNPDVAAAGVNPLVHYALSGAREGRLVRLPSENVGRSMALNTEAPQVAMSREQVVARALFDATYYCDLYPDVAAAKVDPFEHYMSFGWRELRDPNAYFSTSAYLSLNPDVAAAGVNPLTHYALSGAREGRVARYPSAGIEKGAALNAVTPRQRGAMWQPVPDFDAPLSLEQVRGLLLSACRDAEGVVLSLSHDQYKESIGGVQNCVADEERALTAAGWSYLHLCPARPLPHLADDDRATAFRFVLTINGRREGVACLPDLLQGLSEAQTGGRGVQLIVHHLMGASIPAVRALARACSGGRVIAWVHDFFTLCSNPLLLRNDLTFCRAPSAASSACLVCCYGGERESHVAQVAGFFAEFEPFVVSPSQAALDLWRERSAYPHAGAVVAPLAKLGEGQATRHGPDKETPLRVAHLGAASHHKGWATFRALVERFADDPRYEFFRFGHGQTRIPGLTEVLVNVTPDNRTAMIDAIVTHDVHVVINWSNCYETFSFTTIEALASGAYVLAREGAGNVGPLISAAGAERGRSVASEVELQALFISGEIFELAAPERHLGEVVLRNGAELILSGAHGV